LIPPWASCLTRRANSPVALGLEGRSVCAGAKLLQGVYKTWWECDAAMVEINPLCRREPAGWQGNRHGRWTRRLAWTTTRCTATRTSRTCAICRGSAAGNRGEQVQSQLHQAGRQYRVPRQWRGTGDGHDGHHPAFRRQPGEFPRRGRRREQGAGHGGVQDHFERSEREGNPGQYFRRHHGLQRYRHGHCQRR
jgi:hypothetical protein